MVKRHKRYRPLTRLQAMVKLQAFFTERHYDNWHVIYIDDTGQDEVGKLIPNTTVMSKSTGKGGGADRITKYAAKVKSDPMQWLLLVDIEGSSFITMATQMEKDKIPTVYYLEGGVQGYRQFLENQARMWQPKAQRKISGKKRSTCANQ